MHEPPRSGAEPASGAGSAPAPADGGPRSPEVGAPWLELSRAHRLLRWAGAELDPVVAEEGWPALGSVVRCLVLAHLGEATAFGLTPIRLARLLRMKRSSLAHHLDVLEREELIARGPRPHSLKHVGVRLTERGRHALWRLGAVLERTGRDAPSDLRSPPHGFSQ